MELDFFKYVKDIGIEENLAEVNYGRKIAIVKNHEDIFKILKNKNAVPYSVKVDDWMFVFESRAAGRVKDTRNCPFWEQRKGAEPFPMEEEIRVNCGTCKFYQETKCLNTEKLLSIKNAFPGSQIPR